MDEIKQSLRNLVPKIETMKDIGMNKKLAKFGDSVTNLIYSIAKTVCVREFDQRKVNRDILSTALKQAQMKEYGKTRSNAHDMANTAEAFIGYMYCFENWSIEAMANMLVPILSQYNLDDYKEEIRGATSAFTDLLTKIKELLSAKLTV